MRVMTDEPKWMAWARKLQAIAQAGLAYSDNPYDLERYREIRDLSVEIVHTHTDIEQTEIVTFFASEMGYPTPKVDVRAALFKDEGILMVRERSDGLWSLPGGWADVDTSLREALRKEAKEEAGMEIDPKRIIAVLDRRMHNKPSLPFAIYKIFVECKFVSGRFKENIETTESGFFALSELPPLSLNKNTRGQIEMCFTAQKRSVHEPFFD